MKIHTDIPLKIDELVSDLAACDRDGCRCWQAGEFLKQISDYCLKEWKLSAHYEEPCDE